MPHLLTFTDPDDQCLEMDVSSQRSLETDQPVHVTVIGEWETTFFGRITDYSNSGVGLVTDQPAPLDAAVKVEWDHTLLLGEVCYRRRQGDGFAVRLEPEHALYDTQELARLAKRLMHEEAPRQERRRNQIKK